MCSVKTVRFGAAAMQYIEFGADTGQPLVILPAVAVRHPALVRKLMLCSGF